MRLAGSRPRVASGPSSLSVPRAPSPRPARWTSGSFSGRPVGRMAGLPLLVKDIEAAAGLATTFGSLPWADARPAERDGVAASRLREADAILLGKTNTPEFALSGHTSNRLFGPTRNPCQPASALEGLRTKKSRPLGIDLSRS